MPPRPSYFAQHLPRLILGGYSSEEARSLLREQGLSFSNQRFDRSWAETVDFLSRRSITETAPLNRKLNPEEIGTATRPRARGYLAQVELLVEDPDTKEVGFHSWGVRSQAIRSPSWYIQRAIDDWIASGKVGRGTPEGTPIGGTLTGAVEFVPPDESEAF